jgi:WD40 repeat protein
MRFNKSANVLLKLPSIWLLAAALVLGMATASRAEPLRLGSARSDPGFTNYVLFSPDGKILVSSYSWDKAVRLWNPVTGKVIRTLTHPNAGQRPVFSPDGKSLAACEQLQRTLHLWDVATGKETRTFPQADVGLLGFSADNKTLAAVDDDGTIRLWDLATGKLLRTLPLKERVSLWSIAFSPDGKTLAHVKFQPQPWPAAGDADLALRPGGDNKLIDLRDVATGQSLRTLNGQQPLAFAADGKTIAFTSKTAVNTVCLCDLLSGTELRKTVSAAEGRALVFSPDGKLLASGGTDEICLCEAATGQELRRFSFEGRAYSLAFSPDGMTLASAQWDSTVLLWRVLSSDAGPKDLAAEDLDACWTDLAGDDGGRAYRAIVALAGAPRQAVPYLQQRLPKPVAAVDPQRLARLIADLDGGAFAARQQAATDLEALGDFAEPALRAALDDKPSLEMRRRLQPLFEKVLAKALTREELRWLRAAQALEAIGADAKPVLQALAKGAPAMRLRQDATAALERLARRSGSEP